MNIQLQMAGIGVLAFLLYFYVRRKTVGLYTEIFFKRIMIVTLVDVIMDVLSIVAITYKENIPLTLCKAICKIYLALLIMTACFVLLYICQDIYRGKARIRTQVGFGSAALLGIVFAFLLPISIYSEDNVSYTHGPSVYATYAFCLSFISLTLVMVILKRHKMNRTRVEAMVMWLMIFICAALVQFFNNQILLIGYAGCLGAMILFFKLENPEANLDRETGVFNSHVLNIYMEQLYDGKKNFSVLLIRMEQHANAEKIRDVECVVEIAHFLDSLKGAKVFKHVECEFLLLFEDKQLFEAGTKKILERFEKGWGGQSCMYEPMYISIKDSAVADSAEEIYKLLRFYKQNYKHMNVVGVLEIDKKMVEERRQHVQIYKNIVDALQEDRVEVFFQPIYSAEKGAFSSAEALVRMRNTDGTIVPPGKFIPVAEENGMIDQIGERVFEKVCEFIQRERIWEWGMEYIEVNLSVRQCESNKLAKQYEAIMERYHVDPSMINLEVTESASIQKKNILLQNMEQLIKYGVTFSLDDFGNGESNLNYIVDMPVEIVKFDRDMTTSYFEKPKGKLVMETAIRMILDLNLKIVSEGVETKEQLEAIKKLGVQYIQGYYFSKPLPQNEFVSFVKENNLTLC